MKTVAIVGGGILGLAIGYELSISHPSFKVTVFEKEDSLGKHQLYRPLNFWTKQG